MYFHVASTQNTTLTPTTAIAAAAAATATTTSSRTTSSTSTTPSGTDHLTFKEQPITCNALHALLFGCTNAYIIQYYQYSFFYNIMTDE